VNVSQENMFRSTLRAMTSKNGYAYTSGFLEGTLLAVLTLYVKDRDVEKVLSSFTNQIKQLKET